MKKLLTGLALLGGEAIIIAAFILFKGHLADNVLVMNIVVTSLIYGLLCFDVVVPWINPADPAQRRVGSLGVRWFFTWAYVIAATLVMLGGNVAFDWSFSLQLIIQSSLFVLWLLGLIASLSVGDKVEEVHRLETRNRSGIEDMKKALQALKEKMSETGDLPDYFTRRILSLEEELRFISPANQQEAFALEQDFIQLINEISYAVSDFAMNENTIKQLAEKAERVYQKRKSIYSR